MAKVVLRHKAGELKEMLEYVQATGKNVKGDNVEIMNDCLLVIEKGKLHVDATDENQALMVSIDMLLDKSLKQTTGKIPIELPKAIKALSRFKSDDVVIVEYEDNFIDFSRSKPKLREHIPTIGETDVDSAMEEFPIRFGDSAMEVIEDGRKLDTVMEIEAAEFAEIVKDGEQIQNRLFPIVISGGVASVMVENLDTGERIERNLDAKKISNGKDLSSLYSEGFGNAFDNLSGAIKVYICKDGPMVVVKKTEQYTLHYAIAHSTINEDEDEEEEEEPEELKDEAEEEIAEKKGKTKGKKEKEDEPEESEETVEYEEGQEDEQEEIEDSEETEEVEEEKPKKDKAKGKKK